MEVCWCIETQTR